MLREASSSVEEIEIQEATIDGAISENAKYTNWLKEFGGQKAVDSYVNQLRLKLASAPTPRTLASIPLRKVGGVRISEFTYSSRKAAMASDPINLVFITKADRTRLVRDLENQLFPPWLDTKWFCAECQWVRVENPVGSRNTRWIKMLTTRAIGGCTGIRCHLRLFDVGYDSSPGGVGKCIIGNVHYETWHGRHVVQDWDRTQKFVETLFLQLPTTGKSSGLRLQQPGNPKKVPNDGIASMIPLI